MPSLQQSSLPLPPSHQTDEHFVHVISNLLTPEECDELISAHTTSKDLVRLNATYTSRLREVYDDSELCELLWERLSPLYDGMKVLDEEGQSWVAFGLNDRFRFCKYLPGDSFGPHFDSRYFLTLDTQSFLTVNIYLSDVSEVTGGATRFLDQSTGIEGSKDGDDNYYKIIGKMQPVQGSAAIFRDLVFHDGEPLKDGVKYLLRTDVMFERETPFDFERLYGNLTDHDKGCKALDLAKRLEDAKNTNEAVKWYKKAFRLNPELERGS